MLFLCAISRIFSPSFANTSISLPSLPTKKKFIFATVPAAGGGDGGGGDEVFEENGW